MKNLILGFIDWRKDVKHDKLREQKLVLYRAFGFRDRDFDYKKHVKGNLRYYINKHKGK